ncbi:MULTISPECIES: nuclear transport factor 2 family protein [Streptomyces]|uniref:Nuclear transport factor 2 family protein n=2 Tax=Streptomyces TaxID=1883 RepID=A0ABV9IZ61_9ACTN
MSDPKVEAVHHFFSAYAANDVKGMSAVLAPGIEWSIPGHHPLSGTKHGLDEVDQLGKAGFQAEPIFLGSNDAYVVDIHRGWTTQGLGQVDTMWALVWHFDADGLVDQVLNLSGDQHQMDNYVWANFPLAPLPARLAV